MAQSNVRIIQDMYKAFAKGDVPAVLEAMDPRIEWNEAESFPYADGNPYIGPSAIVDGVFKRLGEEWDDWSITTDEWLDAGDSVVVLGRYRSAFKKTGASLNAQFAHVWWLRNGKVARFQQYTDTAQVAGAVSGGQVV